MSVVAIAVAVAFAIVVAIAVAMTAAMAVTALLESDLALRGVVAAAMMIRFRWPAIAILQSS